MTTLNIFAYFLVFYVGSLAALLPRTTTDVTAKYDDITANPALPLLNKITLYKSLFYNTFTVANQSIPAGGIIPQSETNVICAEDLLLNGIVLPAYNPYITSIYPESKVKCYNLKDLFYGCVLSTAEGTVDTAVSCTITVTGYYEGKKVASQQLQYTFPPIVKPIPVNTAAPMLFVELSPDFSKVDNVTFVQENRKTQVLELDNVRYDVVE